MKPLIKLVAIKKTYQMDGISVKALDGIDLQINKGDLMSIIGPSGSGKSTLMHIIGCLDRPSEGKFYFDNRKVAGLSDEQLAEVRNQKIGFIFQSFNLLPRVSALKNVELPLLYSNISSQERRKRALEQLKKVGLEDRVDHHPNQLSGGQQQRVAIARALVNNPQMILADEPTGNLDTKSGQEVMTLLKSLNQKGHTIVIVTHDPELAQQTKKIVKLLDGKIVN
ncbi:MAG TPA: ABC transporter ATP-binding protein [Candidatus Bathyarchaeia archaeon]|nr:ABC transporter ATP-binding protein [Candidatus Bathyarchaeia archaeon]